MMMEQCKNDLLTISMLVLSTVVPQHNLTELSKNQPREKIIMQQKLFICNTNAHTKQQTQLE